jgi:hypothetical protein
VYRSTVVIEELISNSGAPGRVVVLGGPSLPLQGATWSGSQRVATTWYPGNPDEATQGVLGPTEMPSKWNGEWNRTRMGRLPAQFTDSGGGTSQIVDPSVLRDALESMFRSGRRLRVTWSVDSDTGDSSATGKIVREGRATEWNFKHVRWQDIEWDVNFAWASRGGTTPRVTSTRGNLITSVSAAYQAKINALINANTTASLQRTNPSQLTLGQLEQLADYPTTLTDALARQVTELGTQVGQVIDIAATLATQPVQIAQRATNLARNTVAQTNGYYDTISRIPYEKTTNRSRVDSVIRAAVKFSQMSDMAQDAAQAGQLLATQMQQTVQATSLTGALGQSSASSAASIQRAHVCKNGDTPERLSMKYYGNPDHGVDILKANRLSWYMSTFPVGKVLLIPSLTQATTTQSV